MGITPVFFDEEAYCQICKAHRVSCDHSDTEVLRISGSKVRKIIGEGAPLPPWLIREEISEMLVDAVKNGKQIFVT